MCSQSSLPSWCTNSRRGGGVRGLVVLRPSEDVGLCLGLGPSCSTRIRQARRDHSCCGKWTKCNISRSQIEVIPGTHQQEVSLLYFSFDPIDAPLVERLRDLEKKRKNLERRKENPERWKSRDKKSKAGRIALSSSIILALQQWQDEIWKATSLSLLTSTL